MMLRTSCKTPGGAYQRRSLRLPATFGLRSQLGTTNSLPPGFSGFSHSHAAEVHIAAPPPAARQLRVHATPSQPELTARGYQPPSSGFKVFRITGDGSCMFRAIVQGVQMCTKGSPLAQASETSAAHNLRAAIVNELRSRKSEMEPFIAGITDNWEEYLSRMSHPAAWGGEPEMVMAVNVIRRPITVYRSVSSGVEPIVTYGEELVSSGMTPVHLLWSGMHYDLLLPTAPPSGSASAQAA